jgi:hypothetical protein
MSRSEERELVNAIFAAALVVLAIFLGFVGVLAAVQPEVERVSYLRREFAISVWSSVAGTLLAAFVSGTSLAYLSGCRAMHVKWILAGMYALIVAAVAATQSLVWAISL